MKSIWREIVMALIMGMILPGILLNWVVEERQIGGESGEQNPSTPLAGASIPAESLTMRLRNADGGVEEMEMDAYLVGVILAELPASFEPEAKKAQSVAARTFARKAYVTGGKHGDGSVCEKPGCCQAYISEEAYLARGGTGEAVEQAHRAVAATSGYVLTYEEELIEATYFSCSGGTTEDAVAVWGSDFPYLRSTDSPGEEQAAHYMDTIYFTRDELEQKLNITLSGKQDDWFGMTTYTAGDGVNTMEIGGQTFSGTQLRSLLGLRSTAFSVEADGAGVTITTRGFGHRVGMSQYGADAMAASGKTWQEILAHYYRGTSLELTNDRE